MTKKAKPGAKPVPPKAKKSASPKQTGGGGGVFEEEVIAYFLADMLTGRAPFTVPNGKIIQLDTQRPAAVWPLDDLLLVIEGVGKRHRIAFSIKSNQQFTAQGFPADFVRSAWEQLLTTSIGTFDATVDFAGFITAPLNADYANDLSGLLNRSQQQEAATLAKEINLPNVTNARTRELYRSFACPADLAAQYPSAETLTGRGLARLIWQPFDFEEQQSQRVVEVRDRLRAALVSGAAAEAAALWSALCREGRKLRPNAGSRTLPRLADELRHRFQLLGYPDNRADWVRMREAAESVARQIPQRIGGQLVLRREEERHTIEAAFTKKKAVVLRGASGTGKSVLASLELLARNEQEPVLWVDAESMRGKTLASWRQELGLQESIITLVRNSTAARGLCIVDRLDKIYDNTFAVVAELIKLLQLDEPHTPWQLLIPCVGEEWERVQYKLLEHGIIPGLFQVVEVGVPGFAERQEIWTAFPQLAPLQFRPHLNEVLLRPKMLDILARSIVLGQLLDDVVGETSVAGRWLADLAYQGGTVKQLSYATNMAVAQADTWQNSLANNDLPELNSEAIEELAQQRVCVKRLSRVAFEHDLYGDWLRLAQLRNEAQRGTLVTYLSAGQRLTSPLWQRALRLYGVALLDEQPDTKAWQQLYTQLAGIPQGQAGQDLLLDATWYAADPNAQLLALWPLLTTEEGAPLHRLLTRFLHAATRPNERILKFMREYNPDQVQRAVTLHRWPEVSYWPPVLAFLFEKRRELPSLTWRKVAKIAHTWLQFLPNEYPYRAEAAAVAVELGEELLKRQQAAGHPFGELSKEVWPAVLAAAVEEPDQVAILVLEAAGRRPQRFLPPPSLPDPSRAMPPMPFDFSRRLGPQWPDGPAWRVDDELQKVAWGRPALAPLLQARPEAAQELALALLIEEPKSLDGHQFDRTYGLEKMNDWEGIHYQNGPFLMFLENNEAIGIELLLRLERRAMAGWFEEVKGEYYSNWAQKEPPAPFATPTIWLDLPSGSRTYMGDSTVYGWHRGAHPSSIVMTCALMALEKHLYSRLDTSDDITGLIEQLLQQVTSVAVLGVLVQVSKYHPGLLNSLLQPLLASPELQQWDQWLSFNIEMRVGYFGLIHSQKRREELHEWHNLPHRKTSFKTITHRYFLQVLESRSFFEAARKQWQQRLAANTAPGYYGVYIDFFNIKKYTFTQISPTQQYAQYQETPEEQAESEATQITSRIEGILFSTATKRNTLDKANDAALSEQELEQLWEEVEFLKSVEKSVSAQVTPISNPAAVSAATAALFLLRGRQWLVQYPEREAWCATVMLSGAQALWEQRDEKTERTGGVSGLRPSDFVAEGLPLLWAENNESVEVRQAVGQLMLTAPVEALRRFVKQAADLRTAIGPDYYRAAHMRMLRAWQWYQRVYPNGKAEYQHTTKSLAKAILGFNRQRDKWLNAFLKRRLDDTLPALHTLTGPVRRRRKKQTWRSVDYRRELKYHPFKEELMATAYAGLPTPVAQPEWLPFWCQTLVDTLARLQPAPTETLCDVDGFPREWDLWLFAQVAEWLPQLPPPEARRFWEPLLALGAWAHEWVKRFLLEWTQRAFARPDNAALQLMWREMIDYALVSKAWATTVGLTAFSSKSELWRALLTLDYPSHWRPEHQNLAESLRPRWASWAWTSIGNPSNAAALATFLTKPAATGMVLEGLPWLARPATCSQPELDYWKDVADPLADLLLHIWQTMVKQLRQDVTAFEAFKRLLSVLVARQHPLGLQLIQLVGQS
jgi:hypothetical protein